MQETSQNSAPYERIITINLKSKQPVQTEPPKPEPPPAEPAPTPQMKQAYVIHTLLFCLVLFAFGILSLTLDKPTVSEVEKRELATMPEFSKESLFSGSYVRDVEMHYADTFPMRDTFVQMAAVMDDIKGVRMDGVRIYTQTPQPGAPEPIATRPPPPQVTPPAAGDEELPHEEEPKREIHQEVDDGAIGEQSGSVFVYKEKGMSMFGGSNTMGEWYAEVLSEYAKKWGEEVQVYNIVVPTAIEFALPERLQSVTSPQKPNIDHIYESLDPSIRGVDAYTEIGIHADEYVYFNADHHWTGLGAYYAYRAFCQSAELEPLELTDYDIRRIEGDFFGTMYTYTNDAKLASDYVEYYVMPTECTAIRYDKGAPNTSKPHSVWAEYAKSPNSYAVFLHGDFPLIQISTEAETGRRALVVKESFGNAFAPFLIPHYDEVYVVDQRYFEKNLTQFVRDNEVDDVIFINNIFAANTKYHIECIESLQ